MISGRVLIVDDDALTRSAYGDALSAAGLWVEHAGNGEAGLQRIAEARFDILITDLRMPGMDGLQLLLAAKRRDPRLDVILVTAVDSVPTAVEALKAGAWHYLVKPVEPQTLYRDVVRCLERRRLAEALDDWRRQAELLEVSSQLRGELEPSRLRRMLLDALIGVADADAGLMIEAHRQRLVARAGRGLSTAAIKGLMTRLERLFGGVLPEASRRIEGEATASHGLFVPLLASDGPVAVVALFRPPDREPFSDAAAREAGYLATLMVDALRTADAHASIQRVAVTDPLTGLGNAARLEGFLADTDRRPLDRPYAVLFMDLDRFKAVNDTYGHRVGSQVLGAFGGLLRAAVPEAELLARYGGDEFVAVVSGDATAGVSAAARVLSALRLHQFEGPGPIDVGVSIGVASWPADGVEPSVVLERADAAMYLAKAAGRGRVIRFYRAEAELSPPPVKG